MITKHAVQVKKDLTNNRVTVVKEFDAEVEQVWKAWTNSRVLDKWWAPRPWKAETNQMRFEEGGAWTYAMVGPEGERHHAIVEYLKIDAPKRFTAVDSFADEKGQKASNMPSLNWEVSFAPNGHGTTVTVEITAAKAADIEKILEMGFEEGFKMALENLDELLVR